MPRTTPEQRAKICALIEEGYSTRQLAFKEGIHYSTIARIYQRYKETFCYSNKPVLGRPRLLKPKKESLIVRQITKGEFHTAVDVSRAALEHENITVSPDTIRRILVRHGFKARCKIKKPLLKKNHKKNRLNFAKKYRHWTYEDWRHVIWSDESKFMLFGSDGRKYCWKRDSEPLSERTVTPTV
jgi:transposase